MLTFDSARQEGAIALAYPEDDRRAHRLSLWLILIQLGSITGGSINLALNVKKETSGALYIHALQRHGSEPNIQFTTVQAASD